MSYQREPTLGDCLRELADFCIAMSFWVLVYAFFFWPVLAISLVAVAAFYLGSLAG